MRSNLRWRSALFLLLAASWAPVAHSQTSDPVVGDPTSSIESDSPLVGELPDIVEQMRDDVDRWVMRDLILEGTPARMADGAEGLSRGEASFTYPQELSRPIERQRLETLLRGEPAQHHRVDVGALNFDIPVMAHPLVDLYIEYFTGRGRLFFGTWLNRAARYLPVMRPILAEHRVPQDLVYLAMIESGFSAHAFSSAQAAGFWQFMGATGRVYGLKQDVWQDERRDFVKATHAAARYLDELHRSLKDWHLAWASYNAGESRVRRALDRERVTTFWQLCDIPQSLAKETQHYVPKIIAAAIIAKDAGRYGFTIKPEPALAYDEIDIEGALDLQVLAREIEVPTTLLKDLNPSFLYEMTPPHRRTRVRVPKDARHRALSAISRLPKSQRILHLSHKIVRGDSLIKLSHLYRCDVESIRAFNQLRTDRVKLGQNLMIPAFASRNWSGVSGLSAATRASQMRVPRAPSNSTRQPRQHTVRAGESLWTIARRYRTTMDKIRSRKRTGTHQIRVGEVLEIL